MAVAVASGRVGYVCLVGDRLREWRLSCKAARSRIDATEEVQIWINELEPTVLVTEKPDAAKHKGDKTKRIIAAIAATAAYNHVHDISIVREQRYANKYEEAEALARQYPEIKAWCPRYRRAFDNEPRNTVLFEALSMAEQVRQGGTTALAASLG